MDYSFNGDIAQAYGVDAAIFIHNLYWWIRKNEANGRHYHDGRNWTYNSAEAFADLFPFWSAKQVRRIIRSLADNGVIFEGNYNQRAFDRTKWYALSDDIYRIYGDAKTGKSTCPNGKMELPKRADGFAQTGTPIPDSKPYSKPDIESIGAKAPKPTRKRFEKPTVEDVKAYCQERHNSIDAERFVDYYEANGWMVGKSHMCDWRAAVRNWERRGGCSTTPKSQTRGSSASFNAMDLDNDIRPLPPVGQGRQQ